jgi:hypothetical protein
MLVNRAGSKEFRPIIRASAMLAGLAAAAATSFMFRGAVVEYSLSRLNNGNWQDAV